MKSSGCGKSSVFSIGASPQKSNACGAPRRDALPRDPGSDVQQPDLFFHSGAGFRSPTHPLLPSQKLPRCSTYPTGPSHFAGVGMRSRASGAVCLDAFFCCFCERAPPLTSRVISTGQGTGLHLVLVFNTTLGYQKVPNWQNAPSMKKSLP